MKKQMTDYYSSQLGMFILKNRKELLQARRRLVRAERNNDSIGISFYSSRVSSLKKEFEKVSNAHPSWASLDGEK